MKRLKIPRLFNPKKMLAATARRASAASAGMDFEGIPEPNMKLSRALLIVLLLHVVAVSGIIAFNAIKTRERAFVRRPRRKQRTNRLTRREQQITRTLPTHELLQRQKENDRQHDPKPSHSPAKDKAAKTLSPSGKTYVVKKGDNPVAIAKKLKVSYSDLMALNHVEDPRKLQIGQKLLIPNPPTNRKKTEKKRVKSNASNPAI